MDIAALLENRKKEKGFTPESFCESVLNEYGYRAHVLASLMAFDQMDAELAARWADGLLDGPHSLSPQAQNALKLLKNEL